MPMLQGFTAVSPTLDISATSSASTSGPLPGQGNAIRIVNEGPNIAFISVGAGAQTATLPATSTPVSTCTPCPVGDTTMTIPYTGTILNVSAICRSTQTARLSIQVGEGI